MFTGCACDYDKRSKKCMCAPQSDTLCRSVEHQIGAQDKPPRIPAQVALGRARFLDKAGEHGSAHLETMAAAADLAVAMRDADVDTAVSLLRSAVAGARQLVGDDHPATLGFAKSLLAILFFSEPGAASP